MSIMKIIGLRKTSFKPEDSKSEISGYNLYFTYSDEKVMGLAADRVFVKEELLKGKKIVPGSDVHIWYNKWGKVDGVENVL